MIAALDSYYSYVVQQMTALGATVTINGSTVPQPLGGVINADDWPLVPPIEGGLYLLFLSAQPAVDPGTWAQQRYEYFCQWQWLLIGENIQPAELASNRGDRYRQNFQIMSNLKQANYAGFCQKKSYACSTEGIVTGTPVQSVYPYSSIEMVTWGQLRFMPRQDNQKSGLVFGAAAVELLAYDDVNVLVA